MSSFITDEFLNFLAVLGFPLNFLTLWTSKGDIANFEIRPSINQGITTKESHLELKSLPNAGISYTAGHIFKIFAYHDQSQLFFLFSDHKKNALFYNFNNHTHRIMHNTKMLNSRHRIDSNGIRVGQYIWIIGGSTVWEPSPEDQSSSESEVSTLLWSISRQKWIYGPDFPKLLQNNDVYTHVCSLAIDSKTVWFFWIHQECFQFSPYC